MKNKKKSLIFLAFLAISLFSNIAIFGQTIVKMKKRGGVFLIPCKVNGLDMDFIFDTGASSVSISLTEALYMLKHGQLKDSEIIGSVIMSDATGRISEGTKIIIREINVSGLIINNIEATVVGSLNAPLLLGQTAMSKLGRFTFDNNSETLIFLEGANNSTILANNKSQKRKKKSDKPEVVKDSLVLISTEFGDIKLKLYKETPIHRSNFLKLVNQGTIDSTLFHRVIQNFMIQGGDPASKKAAANAMLGDGELGYTLPAEFNPTLYHKKGVLAAARQGDDVNPKKSSSACQFYIVQGKTFSDNDLNMMEQRINGQYKQSCFSKIIARPENASLMNRFIANQQAKNQDSLKVLSGLVDKLIEAEPGTTFFKYSENARKDYATVGGTPHLDGNYTVFGEVVSGLEVVDKIAAVQKGQADRPLMDVRMRVKLVLE